LISIQISFAKTKWGKFEFEALFISYTTLPSCNFLEIGLNTPALLFPALTLIMLAYTNRFLALGSLIRNLHREYQKEHDQITLNQIHNLKHRLRLIRNMQVLGVLSLTCCVFCMAFIFSGQQTAAQFVFGLGIFLLAGSLMISIYEIIISTKALNIQLSDIEGEEKGRGFMGSKFFSKS
jgi:hypothetical protein